MSDFRSHLWDIFVYLGIGALTIALIGIHDVLHASNHLSNGLSAVEKVPAALAVVVVLAVLMLLGALIEPLANYFGKVAGWAVGKCRSPHTQEDHQTVALAKYIQHHFTNDMIGEGTSPYVLCKEYVEAHKLSPTFMPFLAKFGFYRSASFCIGVFAANEVFRLVLSLSNGLFDPSSLASASAAFALVGVYLHRSRQFYSYQAPVIYAAFLNPVISKLLETPTSRQLGAVRD